MLDTQATSRFIEALRATGSYRTDPHRPRGLAGRLFGSFDLWYYFKFFRLVYSGHRTYKSGDFDNLQWATLSFSVIELMEDCGATIEISGVEHPMALKGPTVYIGNHMSMADSFLLPVILNHIDHFAAVVKKSLTTYPFFGSLIKGADPISVGRENPRADLKSVLAQGKRALQNGRSVLIFPQATRSVVFDPKAFNSLGIKLAKSAGVPVTPIALKTDFQGNGRILKDFGRLDRSKPLRFKIGRPLKIEGNGKQAQEAVIRFITETLAGWKDD